MQSPIGSSKTGNSTCPSVPKQCPLHSLTEGKGKSLTNVASVVGCHYLQVFRAVWNGAMCVCIDPLCSPFSMLFVPCDQNHSVSKLAHLLYVIDNEGIGSVLWEGRHRKQRAKRWPSDVQGATESISEVVVWRPIWREKCVHGHYGEICPWSLRWSGPRHRLFANNRLASQLFQCCLTPEGYIYMAFCLTLHNTTYCPHYSM